MSDPKTTPADPSAPHEHPVARVGHVDAGHIVETVAGEPIEGVVTDITDGDDHRLRSHHAAKQGSDSPKSS